MITVSASAVRIPFDIPPQVTWYPTSISFVLVAVGVGAVISYIAVAGFKKVAQFAEVCAPWMVLMFFAGAMAMLPLLTSATTGIGGLSGFTEITTLCDDMMEDPALALGEFHTRAMNIKHNLSRMWWRNDG